MELERALQALQSQPTQDASGHAEALQLATDALSQMRLTQQQAQR